MANAKPSLSEPQIKLIKWLPWLIIIKLIKKIKQIKIKQIIKSSKSRFRQYRHLTISNVVSGVSTWQGVSGGNTRHHEIQDSIPTIQDIFSS